MKNLGLLRSTHYPEISNKLLYLPLVVALGIQYTPTYNLLVLCSLFGLMIAISYWTIVKDHRQLRQFGLHRPTKWCALLFPLYVIWRNRETGGDRAPTIALIVYLILSVWITVSGTNKAIHDTLEITSCVKIIEHQLNAGPREPICQRVTLTHEDEDNKWTGYALLSDEATIPVTVWDNHGVRKVDAELSPGVITTIFN